VAHVTAPHRPRRPCLPRAPEHDRKRAHDLAAAAAEPAGASIELELAKGNHRVSWNGSSARPQRFDA
jgi:hypothetical protein